MPCLPVAVESEMLPMDIVVEVRMGDEKQVGVLVEDEVEIEVTVRVLPRRFTRQPNLSSMEGPSLK